MYIFYMKLLTSCSQSLVLVFLVCLSFSCVTHAQSDEILDAMIFDGVLLNTAVAKAQQPPLMAKAFANAIEAGRAAYESGLMIKRQTASPSTPTIGQPFWHQK